MADYSVLVQKYCSDDLDGESLEGACVVHPPGSTLYNSYAGKGGKALKLGGPIAQAIASRAGKRSEEGEAAKIPKKFGVLALTDHRVLWFRAKPRLGVGPKPAELVVSWPRDDVAAGFDGGSKSSYPGFVLSFRDGTEVPVFTDKMMHPARLAAAWGIT